MYAALHSAGTNGRIALFVHVIFFVFRMMLPLGAFLTFAHVRQYESALPALRTVKSALYDTMLLAFR